MITLTHIQALKKKFWRVFKMTLTNNGQQVKQPSVYFTTLWLQCFNPDLILERLDLVEAYINESYARFIQSKFNSYESSELDCIERYLAAERKDAQPIKLTDDS